jgi:ABC-type lipoprotein export system ATPase subunit
MVQASSLGVSYRGSEVLHDVNLTVSPGTRMAVTGRSGSGKTTLLLALAGLIRPTEGHVTWPALAADARVRRGQIGMIFQAPSLMPELTALQNTALPLRLRGWSLEDSRSASTRALATVGAADFAEALPAQLSGGQQQRVGIARALAGAHRLVLADEPTGALDRTRASQVATALRDAVAATGGSLVLATHDPDLAAMFAHRMTVVDGTVVSGETT